MKKNYTKSSIIMSIATLVAVTYVLGGISNVFVDHRANAQSVITSSSNQTAPVTPQNANLSSGVSSK